MYKTYPTHECNIPQWLPAVWIFCHKKQEFPYKSVFKLRHLIFNLLKFHYYVNSYSTNNHTMRYTFITIYYFKNTNYHLYVQILRKYFCFGTFRLQQSRNLPCIKIYYFYYTSFQKVSSSKSQVPEMQII